MTDLEKVIALNAKTSKEMARRAEAVRDTELLERALEDLEKWQEKGKEMGLDI